MISVKSHTAEWINHLRDEYIGKDPIIIEKMINALTLVECLAKSSLDFVFKGGTSLMLLLPKSQRFSIDVDIILPEIPKDIEGEFKEMIGGTIFDRFEEDVRSNPKGIPKSHYKFFFSSAVGNYEPNPYILLDILSTDIPYPIVNEFPIKSDIIDQDGKYTNVRIPSINSILGDKLTAFAPTTIGIPYGVEKELEINKQLFDLGVLIDHCDDIKEVSISFKNNANAELIFRKPKNMTLENVFDDIFKTALIISMEGKIDKALFEELERGRQQMINFVQKGRFSRDDAILNSAKAAYLSELIKHNEDNLEQYQAGKNFNNIMIESDEYNKLNKLKKRSTEIFHYWERAIFLKTKK